MSYRESAVAGWQLIILTLALFSMGDILYAQVEPSDAEVEYLRIRELAFGGQLDTARRDAYLLVQSNPGYGDAVVLLSRITAWQGKYETALRILDSLLVAQPDHTDALEARAQFSGWLLSAQNENSVPSSLSKQASDTGDYPQSVKMRGGYYFDSFQEPYTRFWQLFTAGAEFNSQIGKVAGGINMGHLYTRTPEVNRASEFQLSAEAYPVLNPKIYSHLAYSWSPGIHFPSHYADMGIWYSLGSGWVASAGGSYYYFDRSIFIPWVSGEKYLHSYWLSAKMKMHFKEPGSTVSLVLSGRRYFDEINYIQLTAGFGTAPDEPWDISADMNRQKAASVNLLGNIRLSNRFVARAGFGYSSEQYADALRRNRFEAILGLNYLTGW